VGCNKQQRVCLVGLLVHSVLLLSITPQAVYEEVTRSRNVRYSTYRSRFYHVPPHLLHSSGTLPKGRALDGSDLVDVCPACEGDLGGYDGAVYPPAADGTQDASGFHYHERL